MLAVKKVMKQYSAKLLFQWRSVRNGKVRKRRVCEERIVTYTANTPKSALKLAKKYGNSEEYIEEKTDGMVSFEFIGVLESDVPFQSSSPTTDNFLKEFNFYGVKPASS